MTGEQRKPIGAIWRRVRDLAPAHRRLAHDGARQAAASWREARQRLEDPSVDRSSMDIWLREQKRAFAIETGQIEGLYLLRRGVTDTLLAEGFEGVRGADSVIGISDQALRGLLTDQQAALEMVLAHAMESRPLTSSAIKEWHALVTRHQASAAGINLSGRRIEIPLRRGEWKIRPNNPRRQDGFVHEYCPPEQVQTEIERFLAFHESHEGLGLAPELEAAWLHHEFVRIHPFQDGNGRISRLLMAWAYAKAGEFPPVIPAQGKPDYIDALEAADEGNFPALVEYMGRLAAHRSAAAAVRAERTLHGRTDYRHGNGGVTVGGVYHPPEPDDLRPSGMTGELHAAAQADDSARIAGLIAQGADPDARDKHGRTALHSAAAMRALAAIGALAAQGADVNAGAEHGQTALHYAAWFLEDEAAAALLIRLGADPNARDHEGRTALHWAAGRLYSSDIITALIAHGADSQARDAAGATALEVARRVSSSDVIQALEAAGNREQPAAPAAADAP